jgi:4-amino-4-deoxy-L-arabinose transferase-like glycosyltransferase
MRFTNKNLLFGILFIAFLLRFPGIFDGLPAVYNSTEYYFAKYAMSMGARQSLDPQISNYDVYSPTLYIYPMFYQYLILIQYLLIFLVGSLFSVFKNSYDFAVQFLVSPSIFYIISRTVNVLISLLTINVVFKKISKIFTERVGYIAASIFTVSYFMIIASQQAVSDVWLLLFSAVSSLYFLDFLKSPDRKKLILASVFTGFAIGTKYNAGVLLILFLYVIWLERKWFLNNNLKMVFYSVLTTLVCFLIPNPYCILRFPQFLEGFLLVKSQASEAIALERGINYVWEFSQIVKHELFIGVGFFFVTIYYVIKRNKFTSMLLVMIIVTFIYVGSWQKKGIDYLYPIFPAWIFIFSIFIAEFLNRFRRRKKIINTILLLVFLPSLLMGIYQLVLKMNSDTRELTTQWIIENVSKNEKICYDNYHYDLGLLDINRYTNYGAGSSQIPEELKKQLKKYKNHNNNFNFNPIIYKIQDDTTTNENLIEKEHLIYKRKNLDQLIGENTKYFISNSWFFEPYFEIDKNDFSEISHAGINQIQKMYEILNNNYKPVKKFEPDFWTNGPVLNIYKLQ